VTEQEEKEAVQEARTALRSITGGIICSAMEREFFIRGYLAGKSGKTFGVPSLPVVDPNQASIDFDSHALDVFNVSKI
jgi:hypothetical protein